jgi:hypothetical protein
MWRGRFSQIPASSFIYIGAEVAEQMMSATGEHQTVHYPIQDRRRLVSPSRDRETYFYARVFEEPFLLVLGPCHELQNRK